MRSFLYYFISDLLELPVRLAGTLMEIFRVNSKYEIERRIRGFMLSQFAHGGNIRLGGAVRLEGFMNIRIMSNVTIYDDVDLIATGNGSIEVGEGSHIGRKSIINGLGGVEIGKNTSVSAHVTIFSISNTPDGRIIKDKIVIGDNVFIGMGASILPGVSIGSNSTIGAGAVVLKNVAPGQTVVGVPARVLSKCG